MLDADLGGLWPQAGGFLPLFWAMIVDCYCYWYPFDYSLFISLERKSEKSCLSFRLSSLFFVRFPYALLVSVLLLVDSSYLRATFDLSMLSEQAMGWRLIAHNLAWSMRIICYTWYWQLLCLKMLNLEEKIGKRRKRNKVKLTKMLCCVCHPLVERHSTNFNLVKHIDRKSVV